MTGAPPQDRAAEDAVLGAMLVAEPALARVIDEVRLSAADFYLDRHRAIFEAISDLYAASKPVDEISVADALRRAGRLDQAGGKHYVSELAAKVPAAGNAKYYAESVQHDSLLRRLLGAGQTIQGSVAERDGRAPADLLVDAYAQLDAIGEAASVADAGSSWQPVDLAPVLEGEGQPPPSILTRSDGACLLYRGKLHEVAAEPEGAKTWLGLAASAERLGAGEVVAYLDFESGAPEIVERLRALGVADEAIVERFVYVAPAEPLTPAARRLFDALLVREPALVVIDGVTEAMKLHGLDFNDNVEIAEWLALLARPAARAGAAVLLLDHVVKDKEARGRYSIGGQHKLAGVDAAYSLDVVEPFGREREGLVKVRVRKDRPGHVRTFADGDEIALMRLASGPEGVSISLDPPPEGKRAEDPEALREEVERAAVEALREKAPRGRDPLVKAIRERGVKRRNDDLRALLEKLATDPSSALVKSSRGFDLAPSAPLTPSGGVKAGSTPSGPVDPEGGSAPTGPPGGVGLDPEPPGWGATSERPPAYRQDSWQEGIE